MSEERKKRSLFGIRVKMELIRLGKTSRQLAREVCLADSTICDVLSGRNTCERTKEKIECVLKRWNQESED